MSTASRAKDNRCPSECRWVKIKQRPLTETANYSVWPLLKYLMIFTSRQKCPGVIELPPWTFIGVTAASPITSHREVKQATIVCSAGLLRVRGLGSQTGSMSQCLAVWVFVVGSRENTNSWRHNIATGERRSDVVISGNLVKQVKLGVL